MIEPRLSSCTECTAIANLLAKIDCKISETAKMLYNNITLMLGYSIKPDVLLDFLNYKRILIYKLNNSTYADTYTVEQIASKVLPLAGNCKSKCQQNIVYTSAYTTTTTTTI